VCHESHVLKMYVCVCVAVLVALSFNDSRQLAELEQQHYGVVYARSIVV
jgi:hypothetical protein